MSIVPSIAPGASLAERVMWVREQIAPLATPRVSAILRRAAVALAKKPPPKRIQTGQAKGGLARAAALTPERRSEIARTAAQARWRKAK